MSDELEADAVESVEFSQLVVRLATEETNSPGVAIVGLVEALAIVLVVLCKGAGKSLPEAEERTVRQLKEAIAAHSRIARRN